MDNNEIIKELESQVDGATFLDRIQFWTVYVEIAARKLILKLKG